MNVSRSRTWRRRTSAGVLASVVALSGLTLANGATPASADPTAAPETLKTDPTDTLGPRDLELLTEAKSRRESRVTLLIAADKGRSGSVVTGLRGLGGTIAKRADEVGYLRASVPTSAVPAAASLPGVAAVDLDDKVKLPEPEPTPTPARAQARAKAAATGPGADTPADNPYMPTAEIGAVDFKAAHPSWDGRGVTIGVMDTGVDLDHPALQTTSTGERKIVDWFTATDPIFDGDNTWRIMRDQVTGPTFSYAGATWTAPAGTYRINRFAESITAGSAPGGDVNRDGDTTDLYGILYDPATNDVRVDANLNRDFTDDPVMRPYGQRYDVGHFGTDKPETAVRDQTPFVVEFREDVDTTPAGLPGAYDFVNIGIVEDAHGSHVAGITAANDMFGNANLDGGAPGAKLVSARACSWGGGCTFAALTDGMVELVVNRDVDVVNISIGGLGPMNDGSDLRAELYHRIVNELGVQLVFSAGNSGPGINTIGDPSTVTDIVSVAAGISQETYLANYGSETRTPYQLLYFSSRGPREDGGFKPNITAPGAAISTTPLWQPGSPVAEAGYPLPPGYQMINGTSMSAPQVTGGLALLLSAAKANRKLVTTAALRRAIYSSASWIDGVPAHGQGNGQLNVPGAWQLLAGAALETRGYTVDAPVCTPLANLLATPYRGTGIYNRCAVASGGQKPGVARTYRVKVTRNSGPKGTVRHDLRLVGNTGNVFGNVPKHLDLPLGKTVAFNVTATAGTGVHSAIVEVDDPATPAVDFEFMNAVTVAEVPKKKNFSFSAGGNVDRNLFKTYFVTVPEGAGSLQVNLTGVAPGSQTRFVAINPWGVPVDPTVSTACFTNFSDAAVCKPDERSYDNPIPGVWEIEVESRRTSPLLGNPYQIQARVQGIQITPDETVLLNVEAGKPTPVTWDLTNDFGPVVVTGSGGPLGSTLETRPSIAHHEVLSYEVAVPAGASRLDVAIGDTSDPGADLDLYVYKDGVRVAYDADGDSEESVSVADPAAGTYVIEVEGYSVPAGTTQLDYRDAFYSPALGNLSAPASYDSLAYQESTSITGSLTALSVPATGRQLSGELKVVTVEGAVVASALVKVDAVN
ncbi:S8 family serine peptidase [Plantactinospora sp. S1510]|uniref:S8 family serine peptidase n=1 Tax=Plantactinospora alkalitolerans TaxID=2789879 RepID=A0ABS0GPC4_9ACTN|nr:S8 family serine peptidase [Plantactinospora alkalitolerans]